MSSSGMAWFRRVWCSFQWSTVMYAILLAGPAVHAAEYQVAPQPAWVTQRALDASTQAAPGQALDGVFYQLVDQQTQLLPTGRTTFRRVAVQAVNGRGLESASHVNMSFDPSFQAFTLHVLNVHRDGRAQDRLKSTRIKVLQRETELEYRMYDGSKAVDIVLSDIRPGDVVEYAYSIRGTNPALLGKESGRLEMQWGMSVHQLYRRLITPKGQELSFRSHLGDFQPQISSGNAWTEYNWAATNVATIARERDTPRWYDSYPYVEWTSFKDWAAVARWAEPMYAVPKDLGTPLQQEINRIAAAQATPELRLAAVLEFVQSQIRYLGIEIGQGSYRPRLPQKVFQNRYGDCKDKVLLAVAMLRAMGIKADPALVNTIRRHSIADALPSPNAFNHVILKAHIAGVDYWLDPTRLPQKGKLQSLAQANFKKTLVLDGQARALTAMPVTQASGYRRAIDMRIDASQGYDHPSTLTISTAYDGASADDMRDTIRNEDLTELQRKYHNFYLRSYPNMTVLKPFTMTDDEAANRVVTVEHYLVPTLVSKGEKKARQAAYLYAPDMKAMLYRPDDTVRTAPYALKHPEDLSVTMTANLPFAPAVDGSRTVVSDPAFEFEETSRFDARTLTLSYHYRSLADHVPPQNMETFIANLQKARNSVGYGLWTTKSKAQPSSKDLFTLFAFLAGLVLAIQTAIAVVFVELDAWKSKNGVTQRSSRILLLTGISLFWAPVIQAMLWAIAIFATDESLNSFSVNAKAASTVFGVLVLFSCLYFLWYAIWRNRWLLWAHMRSQEPEKFVAQAKRFKLPHLRPDQSPATLSMVPRISWLALIPQLCLLALFIAVAHAGGIGSPFWVGLFTYYVVATGIQWFGQGHQRQGLKLMEQTRFAEAIPKFEASHAFLSKHPWVDRWRAIALLSASHPSLREMALINIAFCLQQLGKEQEAIGYYEQVLAQSPGNSLAEAALHKLRSPTMDRPVEQDMQTP